MAINSNPGQTSTGGPSQLSRPNQPETVSHGLPRFPGGSASASSLSRPAQASRALRPAGLLNRPRRPSSRGFNQAGCPARPLVSYQINRQLSGWNLPPLVTRAVGAHWEMVASVGDGLYGAALPRTIP